MHTASDIAFDDSEEEEEEEKVEDDEDAGFVGLRVMPFKGDIVDLIKRGSYGRIMGELTSSKNVDDGGWLRLFIPCSNVAVGLDLVSNPSSPGAPIEDIEEEEDKDEDEDGCSIWNSRM